jgi:hypothetical protein
LGSLLSSHSRKPSKYRCFLANGIENFGLGVFGDVMCNFEEAVSSGALSMNNTLGDALSIEMS